MIYWLSCHVDTFIDLACPGLVCGIRKGSINMNSFSLTASDYEEKQ
jgi:formylmethanofuran dehydrogenase subunit E